VRATFCPRRLESDRGRERATRDRGLRAETPDAALSIGDEWHAEPLGDHRDVDAAIGDARRGRKRNAELALARTLGLDRPTGSGFERGGLDGQLGEDHGRKATARPGCGIGQAVRMRLGPLSDVHGNRIALEAVVADGRSAVRRPLVIRSSRTPLRT
jgi:hypothetical protein